MAIAKAGSCLRYHKFALGTALPRSLAQGNGDFRRRSHRRSAGERRRRIVFDLQLDLACRFLTRNVGNDAQRHVDAGGDAARGTAGIDLTLSLIEGDHGAALASRVARRLVVYMKRPGGQRQYSEPMALQDATTEPYRQLLQTIAGRPTASWTVDDMAAAAGQTTRSFHRKFVAASGVTPAEAVKKIRCELARALLQTTPLKLTQISSKTGFGSESALRRALQRQYGVTARDLRERF